MADLAAEPLGFRHQERIEAALGHTCLPFSEASFANLFLFRNVHRYHFIDGDPPWLVGTTYDGVRHGFALSDDAGVDWPDGIDCRFPSRAADAGRFNADDSDYIYDGVRLAELGGRELRAKRAQAEAYGARWSPELTIDPPAFAALARPMLGRWLAQTGKPPETTDYMICDQAITLADRLKLQCAVMRSGDQVHGFLMASRLPDGSKALHFAKARRDLPGAYPWLFRAFARAAETDTLNFEQDLGIPGLRRAKRALAPRGQLHKYRLFRS